MIPAGKMLGGPIIPDDDVTRTPFDPYLIPRIGGQLIKIGQNCSRFSRHQFIDHRGKGGIDKQRLGPGHLMAASHRMIGPIARAHRLCQCGGAVSLPKVGNKCKALLDRVMCGQPP
jgi:hypothetical protein